MDDCKTEVKESSEQSNELEKAFTIGMAIGFGKKYDEMDRIMEMIKALAPQLSNKWIPVSERLPEESGRYLAYIVNKYDDKLQYIMTCEYSSEGYWNWFPDDECASDNVIAWMPLPEPYKAGSEEVE